MAKMIQFGEEARRAMQAGVEVKVGGEEYTILKQDDILAIVE